MSETRTTNMERRRARILAEARKMLAEEGFDALKLRDLAEVAGITVPTIYNLIGNKSEVLKALVLDSFARFEQDLEHQAPVPIEEMPALLMGTFMAMIRRDEAFYRASVLAAERLESAADEHGDYGFKREPLRRFVGQFFREASSAGLLRGEIEMQILVDQMIDIHQSAFRDWAHRLITLEELHKRSLQAVYVPMAADAREEFHQQIIRALAQL